MAVPKKVKYDVREANEKLGTPMTPEFSRPFKAICEPVPTSAPEMMSLKVDIFRR